MHADIIQENNLTHTQSNISTVSEPSEMKPNMKDGSWRWRQVRSYVSPPTIDKFLATPLLSLCRNHA